MLGRQLVQLAVSIILARVLTPADFGAVALLAFFSNIFVALIQQGISTAIIQRRDAAMVEADSAFTFMMIGSVFCGVALILLGPWLARFYGLPILGPLMWAAAGQLVFSAFGAVHLALMARDLRFADIAKAGIPSVVLSGILSVVIALLGGGVWALAAQLVAVAGFSSLFYWLIFPWRPRLCLWSPTMPAVLRFGSWLSLSTGLEVFYTQGFGLIIGRLYGPTDLGLYSRASSTQALPSTTISNIITRVALPIFSEKGQDPVSLREGLLSANRMAMFICLPTLVGLALTSDLALYILFGKQWVSAATILTLLALAGTLYPLHALNLQLLLALGRSDRFFRVEMQKKTVGLTALVIGSYYGLTGLAISQLIASAVFLVLNTRPAAQLIDCGLTRQLMDLKGILASTVVMAVVVMIGRTYLIFGPVGEMACLLVLAVSAYFVTGLTLRVETFRDMLIFLRAASGRLGR